MTSFSKVVECLGGEFLAEAFGRQHRVWTNVGDFSDVLSWADLNDIVARGRLESPRLRLHRDGELVHWQTYASPVTTRRSTVWQRIQPSRLHEQLHDGASLVLDAVDELHAPVETLTRDLERVFRAHVQVNVYASWTAQEGFGTHWDDHDVVVFQVEGAKRWRIYGPTRVNPLYRDMEAPEAPTGEPLAEVTLRAGDMLYLPRGWWHAVAATEGRSLHLTCGLQTTTGADLLAWLADRLRGSETVRAHLPMFGDDRDQAAYLATLREEVTEALDDDAIREFLGLRDATDPGRLMTSLPFLDGIPAEDDLIVRLASSRALLEANDEGQVVLRAGGEMWTFAAAAAPVLQPLVAGHSASLGDLAGEAGLTTKQVAAVVTELVAVDVALVSHR
ncbi:cupin domain-containing protein [Streptomyces graminilatus]|uniref:cupin domain-containing protein n=1 Tax=Streptomyces graminilatus TaxID=1464070 RepID=UPI0006E28783|nr:cupin domain-containing protein [Streptomyces graminilatus]